MGRTLREHDHPQHRPARGYTKTHPPFEEGNRVALRHGAVSPRTISPVAEALADEVVAVAPWLGRPAFAAAVKAWSWSEAQCVLLRQWLDEHGVVDDEGNPRPAAAFLAKVEGRAANLRARLGLDPTALANLLATLSSLTTGQRAATAGVGVEELLAALAAEGRAALAAHHGDAETEGSDSE